MIRQAHIYLPEDEVPGFVVPLHQTPKGFVVERRDFTVLAEWRDPIKLATALRTNLKMYAMRDTEIRAGGKPTDYAVFQASTCRTLREFKATYLRIEVAQYGDSYTARVRPRHEKEITLETILGPGELEVETGMKLLRLFDMSVKWSAAL